MDFLEHFQLQGPQLVRGKAKHTQGSEDLLSNPHHFQEIEDPEGIQIQNTIPRRERTW